MKQHHDTLKEISALMLVLLLTFLLVIPTNTQVHAADPSQAFQITIDDGDIIGLGLVLNTAQSFILTQYEPYEIEFIYGNRDSNYLHLTFYFYTTDQTSNLRNESIMYQSNIVENTVYYRIISWDNQTSRYALLYADQPGFGTQKHGIISFLNGTTLVGVGGTLDSNTYSDEQLKTLLDMVEDKAREILSIKSPDELNRNITGPTPPLPSIPSDTGSTDNVPGQKTQTPGFEMIVFLAACVFVCFLAKKTKRT